MNRFEITKEAIQRLHLQIDGSLRSSTSRLSVHCPFHEDKTASLMLNPQKGIYKCFSCGEGGSIEKLFKMLTGQSLHKVLNIQYDDFSNFVWTQQKQEAIDYDKLPKDVTITMTGQIVPVQADSLAIQFLRKRSISFSTASMMQMRVAQKAKINTTHFINRLLIPIYEGQSLISIEGRDLTGKQKPKVLYPAGSTVNSLYDLVKLNVEEPLYIVEGLLDLAILRSEPEFKNSTSIFGANITNRQLHLLNRFSDIIIIPDNDVAGQTPIKKLKEEYKGNLHILKVPNTINGLAVKDVGDVAKLITLRELIERKWLKSIRRLI